MIILKNYLLLRFLIKINLSKLNKMERLKLSCYLGKEIVLMKRRFRKNKIKMFYRSCRYYIN